MTLVFCWRDFVGLVIGVLSRLTRSHDLCYEFFHPAKFNELLRVQILELDSASNLSEKCSKGSLVIESGFPEGVHHGRGYQI